MHYVSRDTKVSKEQPSPFTAQEKGLLTSVGYCVDSPTIIYRRVKQDQNGCQNMDFLL